MLNYSSGMINYHEAIRRLEGKYIVLNFTKNEMLELELDRSKVFLPGLSVAVVKRG